MPEAGRILTVHQAVHGYRNGHRLLAGSSSLDPDSESSMLTMSDVPMMDSLDGEESYLTGYPLRQAHKFVLAKTWSAPESPRRGSVWTHSLLLDYSTLAQIEDVFVLLELFRRPAANALADFDFPLFLRSQQTSHLLKMRPGLAEDPRVLGVLSLLYGAKARNTIAVPSLGARRDEALALGLWRQMWPGLRRSFAFSTRDGADDLMLGDFRLVFDRSIARSSPGEADSVAGRDFDGLVNLRLDLPKRGPTRIRRFLGRYAYDAGSPRLVVPSLAVISSKRRSAFEALASYDRLLRDSPGLRRLKYDLLRSSAREDSDPRALVAAIGMFSTEPASGAIDELISDIGSSPFIANGGDLLCLTAESPPDSIGSHVFPLLLASTPIDELVRKIPTAFKSDLLHARHSVVLRDDFWPENRRVREELLSEAIGMGLPSRDILVGLSSTLSVEDAGLLIEYDEGVLLHLYSVCFASRNLEVLDTLPLRPGFVSRLACSDIVVPVIQLERFAQIVMLTEGALWCAPSETLSLISRSGDQLTFTQPHLATIAFSNASSSRGEIMHSLFEMSLDRLVDLAEKQRLPRICERKLLGISHGGYSFSVIDKLLQLIIESYVRDGKIDVMIFAVTSNFRFMSKLARSVFRLCGEKEFRRAYDDVGRVRGLKIPLPAIFRLLESCMPLFSKPLGKK